MNIKITITQARAKHFRDYQVQMWSDLQSHDIKISKLLRDTTLVDSNADWLLSSIEKLSYLMFCLYTAPDNANRIKHLGAYLLYHSNSSVMFKAHKFLKENAEELFSVNEYIPQSHTMRDILDDWDRANESPLAIKMRAVASYCMAFSLLEKCGLSDEFAEIMYAEFRVKKESKKVTSFLYAIFDVIEFVLSRVQICFQKGSLAPMFHSSTTYLDWFAKVDEVKLMSKMIGNPEMGGFKIADYRILVEQCITKGESMLPFAKTVVERKSMQTIVGELKILKYEIEVESTVSRMRETPMACLIFGNSSIGKSSLTELMGKRYAQVCGLEYSQDCRYDRSPFDQYMSGFKTSHWFMVIDDVACQEPSKCTNGDLSLIDVIQIINCAPYTSNQAELEKKGKIPVLAKLVVANSNVMNMNVFHYFSHPSAVQRRFSFVLIPSVKKEFRKIDGSGNHYDALDGIKAKVWQDAHPEIMGSSQIPDFWDFDVVEWIPAAIGSAKKLALEHRPFNGRKIGMCEMLEYYDRKIIEHIASQKAMTQNITGLRTSRSCGVCSKPYQFCTDRLNHSSLDDMKCDKCHKIECIYKNNCNMCSICHKVEARCSHSNYQPQNEDLQCCNFCEHNDCLWSDYPEASNQCCVMCERCISEEDILEGSCTYCLIKDQYQPQSMLGDMFHTYLLCLLALAIQSMRVRTNGLRSLSYNHLVNRYDQLTLVSNQSNNVLDWMDTTRDYVDSMYSTGLRYKQIISDMGFNASTYLSKRPIMLILGSVLAAITAVKTLSKISKSPIFNFQSEGVIPIMKDEKVDPWKRTQYVLSPLDVGRSVSNYKSLNQSQFVDMISKNNFIINLHLKTGIKRTRAFAFSDRYYLINTHALCNSNDFTIDICRQLVEEGSTENVFGLKVVPSQIHHLGGDVSILFLPQLPPRKNLVDLFAKRSYNATSHGFYVGKDLNGDILFKSLKQIRPLIIHHPLINQGKQFDGFEATIAEPTTSGFCGSPMVAENYQGRVVLGIHSLGNMSTSVVSARVYHEDLVKFLSDKNPISSGDVVLKCDEREYELQLLHNKSVANYLESGTLCVYGGLKGHHSSGKSLVCDTLVAKDLCENENFVRTHGAPDMSSWRPKRIGILPMIEQGFPLRYDDVKEAVDDYFLSVTVRLDNSELELLEKYSEEIAINGSPGVRGVDRIDMNTSAGMPHCKSKINYFSIDESKEYKTYFPKDELRKEIDFALDNYKAGYRNNFIFMGALKDEAREYSKILEGKTRVFTGQSVAHLIIGRQYYLSFIRVMQRNRIKFECAVGTNAHSEDWDEIAHFLKDFSSYMFDGDYKNYDKSMMAMVIMAIFDGIIEFYKKHSKYDSEDYTVMRGVAYDVAFAYVNYFGDLMSFLRNNPSGHLLTVIINSICGSVYLRIGFKEATGMPMSEYSTYVHSVTYGDDVIVAVSPVIRDLFNFETYQSGLAKYKIVFTPASKTGDTYKFKSFEDLDFLKRSFVFSDELNRYISPLSIGSIHKSLVTCVKSKTITPEDQIVQIFSSAHREMWQHGKVEFTKFVELRKRVFSRCNLTHYVKDKLFPSYDNLLNYYSSELPSNVWLNDEQAIDFNNYVLQGADVLTHCKTKGMSLYSYCISKNSEIRDENGSKECIYQGVPQNSFLGMDRLISKVAISDVQMVTRTYRLRLTAKQNNNEYKTMESELVTSDLKQITLEVKASDAVVTEQMSGWSNTAHLQPFDEHLNEYLSRPVEIFTNTVGNGIPLNISLRAFERWCLETHVKNKLSYYGFIRGTFHVRIQADASSFIYGGFLVNIAPGENVSTTNGSDICYHSQKQCAYLDLGLNSDVQLSSQLLMDTEWVDLRYISNVLALHVYELATPQSATGASTTTGFRVYGWMTDVELHGATNYIVQSEDITIHSKQNFAKAQRNVANLGLRNPNLPTNFNLPQTVEMIDLFRCNPIVDIFTWDQTLDGGTVLRGYDVNPAIATVYTNIGHGVRCDHPMSLFSRYFKYWRGDLKFKFKVFKSAHHAGTLRIAWDPTTAVSLGSTLNVNMSKLWNIRDADEFEFNVPHDNFISWFETDIGVVWSVDHIYEAAFPAPSSLKSNGGLVIKVFNRLTSPVSSSTVTMVVHIEPGDNFEFAQMEVGPNFSSYTLQSESISTEVYMGEKFKNLKDVLSRPAMQRVIKKDNTDVGVGQYRFPSFPVELGYDPSGPWSVPGEIVPSSVFYANAVRQTLIARVINMFVGVKGSMNWTISCYGQGVPMSLGLTNPDLVYDTALVPKIVATNANKLSYIQFAAAPYECGREIFSPAVNPIHEVEVPFYSQFRYCDTTKTQFYPTISFEVDSIDSVVAYPRLYCAAGTDFALVRFKGVKPQYLYPNNWPFI